MSPTSTRNLFFAFCFLLVAVGAPAQWTNGQNAVYVIGQPDFETGGANLTQSGMNRAAGIAIDLTNGKLYICDQNYNRVMRYGWPLTANQPEAEQVFGQADFTSGGRNRGGTTDANTLAGPRKIDVDSSGNLWVADAGNHRVVRYSSAHSIASNGPDADLVIGQADFQGNLAGNGIAELNAPMSVLVDSQDNLWIASNAIAKVLRYAGASTLSNQPDAVGVLGLNSIAGYNGPGLAQDRLDLPEDFAMFGTSLFVLDRGNNRIMRWDNAAAVADSDGADADGVLGQPAFDTSVAALDQASLDDPHGIAADSSGRIYIADRGNQRVVTHDIAKRKPNGANADNVFGQPDFDTEGSGLSQFGLSNVISIATDSTNGLIVVGDPNNNRAVVFHASSGLGTVQAPAPRRPSGRH